MKTKLGFICLFIFIAIFFIAMQNKSIKLLGLSELFGFAGIIFLFIANKKSKRINKSIFSKVLKIKYPTI